MGTDLHICMEIQDEEGVWKTAHQWKTEDEYGDSGVYIDRKASDWIGFAPRNYRLFAILADVRNGRGFAGVDTGDRLEPISEARGLPDDADEMTVRWASNWGHDYSWLTLQEIMDYDWTRTVEERGIVTLYEYWRWSRYDRGHGNNPEEWYGGVSGKVIDMELADLMLAEAVKDKSGYREQEEAVRALNPNSWSGTHVAIAWTQRYYQFGTWLFSEVVTRMWKALDGGNPEDVRVIFWFDS